MNPGNLVESTKTGNTIVCETAAHSGLHELPTEVTYELLNLEFITKEVLGYMSAKAKSYDVVSVAESMPTLEGFLTPYLISELDGSKFEVSIEELYNNSEEYEDFYNQMVIEVTSHILEKRETKY